MNFPFYIAQRYLRAKKSHNAINIISSISVWGVAVGTMALVVILSVFNGFDNVVKSLINSFNPDLQVMVIEGKTFVPDYKIVNEIKNLNGIYDICFTLEDKALVRYDERQTIATVKGVSANYSAVNGLDSMIVEGSFNLQSHNEPKAVIGRGIQIYLNVLLNSPRQLAIYVPRRTKQMSVDPNTALNRRYIQASGVFSIEEDFDVKYIIVPMEFARDLFDYRNNEISAMEIKIKNGFNVKSVQKNVEKIVGDKFYVLNHYQQNEVFYKTMQTEKWAIFLILMFILIVASFNVIGTLTMLIIEKKKDILTLRNLGANTALIKKIFLLEGWLISLVGSIVGALLGLIICWLQIKFKLIKLQGSGSFVIDAYPILVKPLDVIIILVGVIVIGYLAAWYPIRYLTQKYILTEIQE